MKGSELGDVCTEGKKPRCASKRLHDQKRSKTRINIGSAFTRWRELLLEKRMKLDAELATFLLDRYVNNISVTVALFEGAVLRHRLDPL